MIVRDKITKEILTTPFIKGAADLKRRIISLNHEFHIDCANELVDDGSDWRDIWGFNIYPDGKLDFVSLINIRVRDNNRGVHIEDEEIRKTIQEIIQALL